MRAKSSGGGLRLGFPDNGRGLGSTRAGDGIRRLGNRLVLLRLVLGALNMGTDMVMSRGREKDKE